MGTVCDILDTSNKSGKFLGMDMLKLPSKD